MKEFLIENKLSLIKAAKILGALLIFFMVVVFWGKTFPNFIGWALSLLLIFGYYRFMVYCLKFCNVNFWGIFKAEFPKILLVSLVSIIFIVAIINLQKTIYVTSNVEFWGPTLSCEEQTFSDPFKALKNLRLSVNHNNYNKFIPMLITLPTHIFGKSFLCYVLYVWIMFALPAFFLTAAFIKTKLEEFGFKVFSCSAFMSVMLLYPLLMFPLFIGYVNVSTFLPGTILLMMLVNLDKSQLQIKRLICIAGLSIITVVQVRTAAYMVVGLFLGYTVNVILSGYLEKTLRRDLWLLCKKFFCIGIAAVLIISPLFFEFLRHSVTFDAATAYSAYAKGSSYFERVADHFVKLGLLIYGIFIIGIISGLSKRKLSGISALLAVWAVSAPMMMCRIQFMAGKHLSIMLLPFCSVIAALIAVAFSKRQLIGVVLISILCLNFAQTYSHIFKNDFGKAFSMNYSVPIRYDIDDIKNFAKYLKSLSKDGKSKIFLFGINGRYNIHTFTHINYPDEKNFLPNLNSAGSVDLRDGFDIRFFDADFVIVTDPVLIGLRPQDSMCVVKMVELMTQPSPISKHFKLIKEVTLYPQPEKKSGVTFKVYKKISQFEKSDIKFVEKIFEELYPGKDKLFKNRFEKYIKEHFKKSAKVK